MNPNDPAFPPQGIEARNAVTGEPLLDLASQKGLTKREYFSAMAMTAAYMYGSDNGTIDLSKLNADDFAKSCVAYAEALIAELSKGEK